MPENALTKILYVEDDPDIQVVAKMSLETIGGFELAVCSSGQEALDTGEAFAPDLILLDVMMPGMDGPTTLAKLRDVLGLGQTPAIFMTAKVMPPDVAHYKSMGAVDVIPKPFNPMELPDQIRDIWSRCHDE